MNYNNAPAKWRGDLEDVLGYEQFGWRKRMAAILPFISSEDKSVMDLGAGNMNLRNLLRVLMKDEVILNECMLVFLLRKILVAMLMNKY